MEFTLEELTNVNEKGAPKDGAPQLLDKRLFVQLLVFGGVKDSEPLINELEKSGIESVLYEDISDPSSIGLLTMSEEPDFFTAKLRKFLNESSFSSLRLKPEYAMLGRTYSLGHERDLEDWLLRRVRRVTRNPLWKWAVWYPLRRKGSFALLPPKEQGEILMEHGAIGRAFGEKDLGHDVRLASYGLDKNDNDFTIGLIGKDLHPLSLLVQAMRKTKQTSTYIEKMGPFFVGKAVYQSGL